MLVSLGMDEESKEEKRIQQEEKKKKTEKRRAAMMAKKLEQTNTVRRFSSRLLQPTDNGDVLVVLELEDVCTDTAENAEFHDELKRGEMLDISGLQSLNVIDNISYVGDFDERDIISVVEDVDDMENISEVTEVPTDRGDQQQILFQCKVCLYSSNRERNVTRHILDLHTLR